MQACDLLIGAGMLIAMDDADTRIRDGAAAVIGDTIVEIGRIEDLREKYRAGKEIFQPEGAVLPGFINAHSHETLTRGLHEDLPLMRWLEEVCYPIENAYSPEDMTAAAMMNQLELIKGGVTSSIDIFRFADRAIEVAKRSGLRMTFSPQSFDATSDRMENTKKTLELAKEFHGSGNGRIRVWFGPHAPYSCGPDSYAEAAELARLYGLGVHTHLCETDSELEIIRGRYGVSPVEYLDNAGVLDVPCILAHSIHLTDDDIRLLADKRENCSLVYNPISNLKLADGVCPVPALLQAGCTLGLGTDSNLSNNALDMFAEMRIGGYIQKTWNNDATIMPCYQMLYLATRGSAAAMKLDALTGSLQAGKRADIIVVSFTEPHMWPVYYENPSNVVEQIVYAGRASDVSATVVDGRVLMENRKVLTLNEDEAFEMVRRQSRSLYRRSFQGGA